MTLTRRKTLALIGGGVVVAAGTGTAAIVTRRPDRALAPWAAAGTYSDPRMRALSWAILAPNPHNRQPWLADLTAAEDEIVLHVDTDRLLPHTDPFHRQITIGLGCFLEVLRLAALEDGLAARIEPFPDGSDPLALDDRPVARIRLEPTDAPPDPLFAQVPHRRTVKEPYATDRAVPAGTLDALAAAMAFGSRIGGTTQEAEVLSLRALTREALRIEVETPRTYRESVDLFRIGAAEVNADPDGIDFTGPLFEGLSAVGMMTREAALDPASAVFRQGLAAVYANADTAMGHVWLVRDGNTRAEQIAAGRDWLRLHLAATAAGIDLQPLSQALQEYPEMAEPYAQVHDRLAPGGGTVHMLARLGYGPQVPPSPRWPVEAKLIG